MARLYAAGAEENITTTGVEIESSGTLSVVTSPVLTGTYAWRFNPSASTGYGQVQVASSNQTITAYVSAHFRFASFPSSGNTAVIDLRNSSNTNVGSIVVTSGGVLQLLKSDGTQIGSDSSALSTNTWYCIQMSSDASGSPGTLEGKLDGTSFASGSNSNQGQWTKARFGAATTTTADIYVDDFIFNNSSGSFCNTYPSINEKVIVIRPDSGGDNSAWSGTYADVDEVTPNDNTDYISSTTINQIEEHNYGASGLGSTDTIVSVSLNSRQYGPSAFSNTPTAQTRIKASSGGTVETGVSVQPGSAWGTNQTGGLGLNHLIVTYDLPGASTTAWTYSDVDSAQAGVQITVDRLGDIRLSTLWITVTYTPATDFSINVSDSITVTESTGRLLESSVNTSDSITITESKNATLVHNVNVSDTITVSESAGRLLESNVNKSDNVTITENAQVAIPNLGDISVSDSLMVSESIGRVLESFVNKSDSITVSESLNRLLESYVNKSDSVTVSESIGLALTPLYVNVNDSISVSESSNVSMSSVPDLSVTVTAGIQTKPGIVVI